MGVGFYEHWKSRHEAYPSFETATRQSAVYLKWCAFFIRFQVFRSSDGRLGRGYPRFSASHAASCCRSLIAEGKGKPFDFTGKRFKEWVLIPADDEEAYAQSAFSVMIAEGDKRKAMGLFKRCLELDPKSEYRRKSGDDLLEALNASSPSN